MTIQLNIGSNIADRHAQIEQAVGLLSVAFRARCPRAVISRSHIVESEPWGYESPNPFLNLGLRVDIPSGDCLNDSAMCAHCLNTPTVCADIPSGDCSNGLATCADIPSGDCSNISAMCDARPEERFPLHPEEVLAITRAVEQLIDPSPHRNADGSYRDRRIDIDIIDIDGISYSSPTLTLPHPRAAERPFVLGPLAELSSMHNS